MTESLSCSRGLSFAGQRMLALAKGKENIDDFGTELKTITIYNVSRDLIIHCNENNLSDYLENINEDKDISTLRGSS